MDRDEGAGPAVLVRRNRRRDALRFREPDSGLHAEAEPAPGPAVLEARPESLLPAQLLQPGEVIVLQLKPSPWYILLEPLGTILAIALVAAAATMVVSTGWTTIGRTDLVLLGVGLGGLRLFWQFLEWLSRVYVLTDRRVIRVQGVLRVQVFETTLKNVLHTNALFSIRERLFGLGTISFATAGTGGTEAFWQMVARPLDVHHVVVQTLNRYR